MLPVSGDVMLKELEGASHILEKWKEKIEGGIPFVDIPAPPDRLEAFLREMCGELLIVAGKCEHLSSVLSGSL